MRCLLAGKVLKFNADVYAMHTVVATENAGVEKARVYNVEGVKMPAKQYGTQTRNYVEKALSYFDTRPYSSSSSVAAFVLNIGVLLTTALVFVII